MSDLAGEMRQAAAEAAGHVIADRIAKAHPGLPDVIWGGFVYEDTVTARAKVYAGNDDAAVWRTVSAYAEALGGCEPRKVPSRLGIELQTVATFEGVKVTVWDVVERGE